MLKNKQNILPVLYSLPVVQTLALPPRSELLPKIETGEIEYIDFKANVFTNGMNRNPYQFRAEDLAAFAASFEGQPFLRDHETEEIEARDGTILTSMYNGEAFVQDIRLTTRRGMTDYLEGRIDRFSIGWFYDDCICSICQSGFFSQGCTHWPGQKYQTLVGDQTCELIFINPKGKETSAVNVPAVEGTGIVAQLKEMKCEYLGVDDIAELKQSATNLNDGQEPVSEQAAAAIAQARNSMFRKLMLQIAQLEIFEIGGNPMKVRELLQQRTALVTEAEDIAKLADAENRDLTETERERFNAILGDEGEVSKLSAQIKVIQDERARLQEAQDAKFVNTEAEKPNADVLVSRPTVMTLAAFNQLSPVDRVLFAKAGGKLEG